MTAVDYDERRPVVAGGSDGERRGADTGRATGAPMTDANRLLGEAAFVIGDVIAMLRVSRRRIPLRWLRLLDALNRSLSAGGHRERVDLSALKTTKQLAAEWGCDARTVRRKAAAAGGRKVHGWIFPEGT